MSDIIAVVEPVVAKPVEASKRPLGEKFIWWWFRQAQPPKSKHPQEKDNEAGGFDKLSHRLLLVTILYILKLVFCLIQMTKL